MSKNKLVGAERQESVVSVSLCETLSIYPTKKEMHTVTFSRSVYLLRVKLFNQ